MTVKLRSRGVKVRELQTLLGLDADGVFGAKTEQAVKAFQKAHGLVADGIVGDKTWKVLKASQEIDIIKLPINVHITRKNAREIRYLVIHYTAGASSVVGSARKNRNVFLTRRASADFVVDDGEIIQVNPDIENYYCWAVGDGNGRYGITNANSVSIEMCSSLRKGTSATKPNHSGWYFTDAVWANAVKLARYLIMKYGIDKGNVVRHYDASRKSCPGIVGWNDNVLFNQDGTMTNKNNNSNEWEMFKEYIFQ